MAEEKKYINLENLQTFSKTLDAKYMKIENAPVQSKTVFIFTDNSEVIPKTELEYNNFKISGKWIPETDEVIPPFGWSLNTDKLKGLIWMSTRVFVSGANTDEGWSMPIQITGENGAPGSDTASVKFIFARSKSKADQPVKPTTDSITNTGWTDSPQGIDEIWRYEWISVKNLKSDGSWSEWSNPALWSKWGLDGKDGDGVEYIYIRENSGNPDNIKKLYPTTPKNYLNDTAYQNKDTEYIPKGWSDNPLDVKEKDKYVWVASRKFKYGKWQAFTDPKLWAMFTKDGKSGFVEVKLYALSDSSDKAPEMNPNASNVNDQYSRWSKNNLSKYNAGKCIWSIVATMDLESGKLIKNDDGYYWDGPIIMSGRDGLQGPPGPQGPAGSMGVSGIPGSDIRILYALGNAQGPVTAKYGDYMKYDANPREHGWVKKMPKAAGNTQHIWAIQATIGHQYDENIKNYIEVVLNDGWSEPIKLNGVDGINGTSGVGIKSVTEYYLASEHGPGYYKLDNIVYSEWSKNEIPELSETKKYLWNFEEIEYTDGTKEHPTSPSILTNYVKDGRGIVDVNEYYCIQADDNDLASKEDMYDHSVYGWTEKPLKTTVDKPYLWNYEEIVFDTPDAKGETTKKTKPTVIGTHGAAGVSIEKVYEYYLASGETDKSKLSKDYKKDWVNGEIDGIPTLNQKDCNLWNIELIQYSNGTLEAVSDASILTNYVKDGRGIVKIEEFYTVHDKATGITLKNINDFSWADNPESQDAKITPEKPYLWNYEKITFDSPDKDGKFETILPPATIGTYGEKGVGIDDVTEYYYAGAKNEGPGTINVDNYKNYNWQPNSIPTLTEDNPFLWNYEEIKYSDNVNPKIVSSPSIITNFVKDGRGIKTIDEYYCVQPVNVKITVDDVNDPKQFDPDNGVNDHGWVQIKAGNGNAIPEVTDTYPNLWNFERITFTTIDKTTNKNEFQNNPPAIIGTMGKAGKSGRKAAIIYPVGVYNSKSSYLSTLDKRPYVYDPSDKEFYVLNEVPENQSTLEWKANQSYTPSENFKDPIHFGGGKYWTKMESFEAVFAKQGIIQNGLIGSFVYNGKYVFSQNGWSVDKTSDGGTIKTAQSYDARLASGDNVDLYEDITNGKWIPNILFDAELGTGWVANQNIQWDADGKVTFGPKATLTWGQISDKQTAISQITKETQKQVNAAKQELEGKLGGELQNDPRLNSIESYTNTDLGINYLFTGAVKADLIIGNEIIGKGISSLDKIPTGKPMAGDPCWRLNKDGSGHLANGNIKWTKLGDITLDESVKVNWGNISLDAKTQIDTNTQNLITNSMSPLSSNIASLQQTTTALQQKYDSLTNNGQTGTFTQDEIKDFARAAIIEETKIDPKTGIEAKNILAQQICSIAGNFAKIKVGNLIGDTLTGYKIQSAENIVNPDRVETYPVSSNSKVPSWLINNKGAGWLANQNICWNEKGETSFFGDFNNIMPCTISELDSTVPDSNNTIKNINTGIGVEIKPIRGKDNILTPSINFSEFDKDLKNKKTQRPFMQLGSKVIPYDLIERFSTSEFVMRDIYDYTLAGEKYSHLSNTRQYERELRTSPTQIKLEDWINPTKANTSTDFSSKNPDVSQANANGQPTHSICELSSDHKRSNHGFFYSVANENMPNYTIYEKLNGLRLMTQYPKALKTSDKKYVIVAIDDLIGMFTLYSNAWLTENKIKEYMSNAQIRNLNRIQTGMVYVDNNGFLKVKGYENSAKAATAEVLESEPIDQVQSPVKQ